jgi:hypothetical protein
MTQRQIEGLLTQDELFKQDSTLDGWTAGVEQMWQSNGYYMNAKSDERVYLLHL